MKIRFNIIVLTGLTLMLVLGACAPASTPTPTLPAPTEAPPTPEPPTAVPTAIPSPTLVPVNLAGPSTGSEMAWEDGSVLVYVPAGEFTMGSNLPDAPEHTVSLSDYWIYKTEVTNSMYAFCVSVGACAPPTQELGAPVYDNPAYSNYPVVGVTWDMAENYCKWIGGDLPTEAQWEKAARGTSGASYPWGNAAPECSKGNFNGCVGALTDVSRYADGASPYGVLDMVGNAFEWVKDFYSESYYNNAPAQNPTGPDSGDSRVVRSSSFETGIEQTASATRHPAANGYHNGDLSFRCAVEKPAALAPMCQMSSYVPSAVVSSGECQVPDASAGASYCEYNRPFTSIDLPQGATYKVLSDGYSCEDSVIDGQRRLTCTGPDNTTGDVLVCNASCSSLPGATGASPTCDSGYGFDSNTGTCLYSPVSADPGVAGCPAGYVLVDRGGQKSCAPGLAGNGLCPDGMYFDSSYGACASPTGGANLPIGLNNPDLAAQNYQGCLPGFSYSPDYQCCQPSTGGAYPGCPLGTHYDANANTCIPSQSRLSGPGCVTVSINMLQCSAPYQANICSKIKTETSCIRNQVYSCQWVDDSRCEYVK